MNVLYVNKITFYLKMSVIEDMTMKWKIVSKPIIMVLQIVNILENVKFALRRVFLLIRKTIMYVYLMLNLKEYNQITLYQIVVVINYSIIIHLSVFNVIICLY